MAPWPPPHLSANTRLLHLIQDNSDNDTMKHEACDELVHFFQGKPCPDAFAMADGSSAASLPFLPHHLYTLQEACLCLNTSLSSSFNEI